MNRQPSASLLSLHHIIIDPSSAHRYHLISAALGVFSKSTSTWSLRTVYYVYVITVLLLLIEIQSFSVVNDEERGFSTLAGK